MTDFATSRVFRTLAPERVESGANAIALLPAIAKRLNASRLLIATSRSVFSRTPHVARLKAALGETVVDVFSDCRQHSPEADIDALCARLETNVADAVVSIGGSSVFDTVKVAIGRNADANGRSPMPQIAIPTTLSAGEFTPGAGYVETATNSKQLVLDVRLAPRVVVLDPVVTLDTPDELWCATGVKALDHAIEAVWSLRPHPYVDALALEAIRLLFANLPLSRLSDNLDARAACQFGAWMSIAGVGGAGMRLSHFLGHQIGASMHIPHGITSCILLPAVMRYLRDETLAAQVRIAVAMGIETAGRSAVAVADDAAERLEALIGGLHLPTTIQEAGGCLADIDNVVENSVAAAKSLGLTHDLPNGADSVREILMRAWH